LGLYASLRQRLGQVPELKSQRQKVLTHLRAIENKQE
jgi:hypothetical protein